MSSDTPTPDSERFRFYITGLELHPSITDPNCKIGAKLFVDDKLFCTFPSLGSTHTLRWSKLLLCHVSPTTHFRLRLNRSIHSKHHSFDFPSYHISDVNEENGAITLEHPELVWRATIKALSPTIAERLFQDKSNALKQIDGIYDSLKPEENVKYLFKIAMNFTLIAGKVLSGNMARLSFLTTVKAWELLDQQTQLDEVIQEILYGLNHVQDIVEVLGQASSSTLADIGQSKAPILDIAGLLEDVSVYIFNHLATRNSTQAFHDESNPSHTYDTETFLGRLEELHENFHASWSPAIASPIVTTSLDPSDPLDDELPGLSWEGYLATLEESITKLADPYEILNSLRPLDPSGYDPENVCLDGTREAVLKRVLTWAENRKNSESLMWVSGQAGMGKTSVATSLCRHLDRTGALAGSLFCQRSDPNLNNPLGLINSLVHQLASRCPPYAYHVAKAIRANRALCTAHLAIRYEGLIKVPLERLKSLSAPLPLVIIIDALDECGNRESRTRLLRIVYGMSRIIPWLKVIITARPEGSLQHDFQEYCSPEPIVHLQAYDASDDIRAYIQVQLGPLSRKEQWPNDSISQLCAMAEGLFLWAALATKYIKRSTIPASSRLQQVLGNRKSPVTKHFDELYAEILNGAMDDDNDDTKEAYNQCIGAILATLEHAPLPVSDLEYLLVTSGLIGEGTLERVVASLGPLLIKIDGQYVRPHHSSFKEYMTNSSCSAGFHVQLKKFESDLAKYCLTVMKQDLRFNICGLETSHLLNDEVPDLRSRIQSRIEPTLKYVCINWIDYFAASPDQPLVDEIKGFLEKPHFMYWIEMFSILGRIDAVISILSRLALLPLTELTNWNLIISYATDAQQFLMSFYDIIVASTPHLYISALAFAPTGSTTARRMRPYFPNTIAIAKGADTTWHPCIKTISHPYVIQSSSISPDGSRIIIGYSDGSLSMWDKSNWTQIGEPLIGHSDSVTCVVISPSGNLIVSGSQDATIRVWDITADLKFPSQVLTGHSAAVNSVAFSTNGSIIASGSSDKTIRLWDLNTMRPIHEPYIGHSSRVSAVVFSPDGTKLASGAWDNTIRVWSLGVNDPKLADDPLLITGHSDAVTCMAFSPDGSKLVSGSADKTVRIWDVQHDGKIAAYTSIKHSDTVTSVTFSLDRRFMASSSLDGAIKLQDATRFMAFSQPFGHFSAVNSIFFSPDGSQIVSGSTDMTTRVWEIDACPKFPEHPKMSTTATLAGHTATINSIAVSSDGSRIVSGSNDNTVRMWDAQTGTQIGNSFMHPDHVSSVAISPDMTRIVSGSHDGTLRFWDTTTCDITRSYEYGDVIHCVAYSPIGTLVAFASSDYRLYLVDPSTCETIDDALEGHSNLVNSVVFSPDGVCIASASADGTVILWEIGIHSRTSRVLTGHKSSVQSVAFSPSGTQLVSGSHDRTIRLWDRETGNVVLTLTTHAIAMSVDFSFCGTCIASSLSNNAVQLWNTKTGQPVGQPNQGPPNHPQSYAFSPDGAHIIFGCNDFKLRAYILGTSFPVDKNAKDPPGAFRWPSNPQNLAPHPHYPGWVSHDQKSLVFWLPVQYQQPVQLWNTHKQVPHPQLFLDYSKFAHERTPFAYSIYSSQKDPESLPSSKPAETKSDSNPNSNETLTEDFNLPEIVPDSSVPEDIMPSNSPLTGNPPSVPPPNNPLKRRVFGREEAVWRVGFGRKLQGKGDRSRGLQAKLLHANRNRFCRCMGYSRKPWCYHTSNAALYQLQPEHQDLQTSTGPTLSPVPGIMLEPDQNVREVWFRGQHTDVGGSAPPPTRAPVDPSNISLRWMVQLCLENKTSVAFDGDAMALYREEKVIEFRPVQPDLSKYKEKIERAKLESNETKNAALAEAMSAARAHRGQLCEASSALDQIDTKHKPLDTPGGSTRIL